jgi:hypothetical protein
MPDQLEVPASDPFRGSHGFHFRQRGSTRWVPLGPEIVPPNTKLLAIGC